jgi:Ku protein
MAARAYWQGQIRLALVSIPVEIFSATKSGATVAFHQIHEPSGKRIKYEKVVPGIGPVDTDEILKGFEYKKGEYVLLDEEEIEGVKLESKKTLELTQFVDAHEIDAIYFDKPYYVVPADDLAEEAFIVLREALRSRKKVGLGQLAMRGREYVISLKPCGRGLVLETLRYTDEVNKAASYFRDIDDAKPDADRQEDRPVRRDRISQPLCRCAARPDRAEEGEQGNPHRRGTRRRRACEGQQRRRPDGSAEEVARSRRRHGETRRQEGSRKEGRGQGRSGRQAGAQGARPQTRLT